MMRRIYAACIWLFMMLQASFAGVTCSLPFNLQNGTTADATQVMANFNALVTCFTNSAAAGANSDITAILGLSTPLVYTSGGSSVYTGGTSTGSGNAQVVAAPTPNGFSLVQGKSIFFIAGFGNATGSNTQFNINGTGLKNVYHVSPNAGGIELLTGGEIIAGQPVYAFYDGTEYVLLNVVNQLGGVGPPTSISSAATTDLSLAVNHNALITGNVGITSFGSNASLNEPQYFLTFSGTATITYNASSMILPGAANITVAANDTAAARYLGSGNWQLASYTRATGVAVVNPTPLCGFVGLSIINNAGTPNTNIDYAADSAVLINPTGNVPIYTTSISGTINTTNGTVTSTADGMDGEARPTSGWLYTYLISDGTNFKGLGSTNTTTPTMPAGYIYRCYAGARRFDGSQNSLRITQKGSRATYTVKAATNTAAMPVIGTGNAGVVGTGPTVALAVASFVPSTATRIMVTASTNNSASSVIMAAPNDQYAGNNTTTNPPPLLVTSNSSQFGITADFLLESTNIYWANSGGVLYVHGWTDKVNAN